MERRKFSQNEEKKLVAEVGRVCPICSKDLFFDKNDKIGKLYEIAHIYPINITPEQLNILNGVEILGKDLNDLENLILLCRDCHKKFDNPRRRDEYLKMVELKKNLMKKTEIALLYNDYYIEKRLEEILRKLSSEDEMEEIETKLSLLAKKIEDKIGDTKKNFKRQIKNNVSDYYAIINRILAELDEDDTMFSDNLSCQIKSAFTKFYSIEKNKEKVFFYLCDWLNMKNGNEYKEESEIIISFFIQNCEVFK